MWPYGHDSNPNPASAWVKISINTGLLSRTFLEFRSEHWGFFPLATTICDDGWKAFKSSCYKIINNRISWSHAKDSCIDWEGHLLIIDDTNEQDYIYGEVKSRVYDVRIHFRSHLELSPLNIFRFLFTCQPIWKKNLNCMLSVR